MVMHPSPGHYTGTLVNALLHHCSLPPMRVMTGEAVPLSLRGAAAAAAAPVAGAAAQLGQLRGLGSTELGPGAGGLAPDSIDTAEGDEDSEEFSDDDSDSALLLSLAPEAATAAAGGQPAQAPAGTAPTIRPGIVHRLDKGTTGLLVVAKDDATHLSLAAQFKDRSVQRAYWAITVRP
jgi:23S rRNA pseudouridine1911/1915/1917 synthase